jgi:hypothetical protein
MPGGKGLRACLPGKTLALLTSSPRSLPNLIQERVIEAPVGGSLRFSEVGMPQSQIGGHLPWLRERTPLIGTCIP